MRFTAMLGVLLLLTGTVRPMPPVSAPPTKAVTAEEEKPYVLWVEPPEKPAGGDAALVVLVRRQGTVCTVPMREYLICVALSELYPDFPEEAFKAQIVAARTVTIRQGKKHKHPDCDVCADAACCQAYRTEQELREKLAGAFEGAWQKASEAAEETDGEVLYYGGELCEATYFASTGGRTESAQAVWGGEVPYLRSVESPETPTVRTVRADASSAREKLCAQSGDAALCGAPQTWIGEVRRTEGGGVEAVTLGGAVFSGRSLTRLFGLPSTDFTVTGDEDGLLFTVRGGGHRVGMSQQGAAAMAESGKTYREILNHYYTASTVERYTPT